MTSNTTTDRDHVAPCPSCGATAGRIITTRATGITIECANTCGFRAPEIPLPATGWTPEVERAAIEAWNALPRPRP